MARRTTTVTTCDWCGNEETDKTDREWYRIGFKRATGGKEYMADVGPKCYARLDGLITQVRSEAEEA